MLPIITIVTPSYNQGAYLAEAIRSVLSQNYPKLQYLVIDGGSTDGSRSVIERYESKLDYWVCERDSGQSDALRKGFARARGGLLGWLNSDDVLYPGALQRIAAACEANPGSIIAGNVMVLNQEKPWQSRVIRQRRLNVHDMTAIWAARRSYSQPGVFFPREAYEKAGGIDVALHQCMDLDLMVRMLRDFPVAYVDDIIAGARLHPASKTCSQAGAQVAEAYAVSRRYWSELPYSTAACRLFSVFGLGRCALGRLRHGNPGAFGAIARQMLNVAAGRE